MQHNWEEPTSISTTLLLSLNPLQSVHSFKANDHKNYNTTMMHLPLQEKKKKHTHSITY